MAGFDKGIVGPKTKFNTHISDIINNSRDNITSEELDEVISFLQNSEIDKYDRLNLLLEIGLGTIKTIKGFDNKTQFALTYTELIKNGSFQYSSCDALASRLDALIDGEGINIQASGIMAMLFLGTNHNRFYVERLFVSKVGHNADPKLMRRLKMEFNIEEGSLCDAINHLQHSISFSIESLHPLLKEAYCKFCL